MYSERLGGLPRPPMSSRTPFWRILHSNELIPCSRNGAILLLNSKDLFYCQYHCILENKPQLPPTENLRILRYPHHPPLAKQILCLGLKMGFEFGPGLKLGFLGQAQGIIFLECFFTKLDTKTLSAIPDVHISVVNSMYYWYTPL